MKIETRPLDQITPYEKNPRRNEGAVEAVARSLQEYGWRQPIVVDQDGVVVVGHTRLAAAYALGWKTAPVHVMVDADPRAVRAYRIADNSTAEIAGWDLEKLDVELQEILAAAPDLLDTLALDDDLERLVGGIDHSRDPLGDELVGAPDPETPPGDPEAVGSGDGDASPAEPITCPRCGAVQVPGSGPRQPGGRRTTR